MNVEERLKELGLQLPAAPGPAANYKSFVRTRNLVFISGQLPVVDGELSYSGHVGSDLSEEEGCEAAKLCALNVLAQIKAVLGSFDRLEMLIRVEGCVNSAPAGPINQKSLTEPPISLQKFWETRRATRGSL